MQGKDEMIADILQSAKKAAAAMIDEATEELNAKVESLREYADGKNAEADAQAEQAAQAVYSGMVKLGELEAGKIMLDAKRRCVSAVYDGVRSRLDGMSDGDYLALMGRLISEYCSDGDEIVVGKSDKRITQEWLNKAGKADGRKYTLSKEKGDFNGGVIARNAKFDISLTFDDIVAELKDGTVVETAQKLGS